MTYTGSCSLIIRGTKLEFDEIKTELNIIPSKVVRRGETISKIIPKSEYDIWIYEVKFRDNEEVNETLEPLLSNLLSSKQFLQNLSSSFDVVLKCYVQSDLAQINFEFSPKVISYLAEIKLRLEVSIFSWGGVEDR
ncbi:DUF4279 domain-containing protein [Hydrogenispora ethanolica]|uniref:DUF4279 domain-containing protein n=1 Tax=Hydrogenispora ethanolica TaxID=1082276 RepID=UPI001052E2B1|nr:DUF4279 domain-containing protein [Hydrogenispora ethanolica]